MMHELLLVIVTVLATVAVSLLCGIQVLNFWNRSREVSRKVKESAKSIDEEWWNMTTGKRKDTDL